MNSKSLSAAMAAVLAICTFAGSAAAQEFQVPVDSQFTQDTIDYNRGNPNIYTFNWRIFPRDNRIAVCGIGYVRDPRFRDGVRQIFRQAAFIVDGQEYPVNLTFFTRARTVSEVATGTATCQVTSAPVPRSSFDMTFGRGTVRN